MATEVTSADKSLTVNGLRIHYLDWGNQGAAPLILLHGLRSYAHSWDGVAREFAGRYHVMAIDQRGRGESDWSPNAEYHTEAYVSDLEELISQIGLKRFVLMGHSMGGTNTIVYASRHPDQIRGAIVVDMGPAPLSAPGNPGSSRTAQELENTPVAFDSWGEARAFYRRERPTWAEGAYPLPMKETADGKVTWQYDLQGIREARRRGSPSGPIDLWPHVRNLRCPTLVLRGAISDVLAAETCRAMQKANSNLQWVEVPAAGHTLYIDNLSYFNQEVSRFLSDEVDNDA